MLVPCPQPAWLVGMLPALATRGGSHTPYPWTMPKPWSTHLANRPGVPTPEAPILAVQSAGARHGHHTPLPRSPWGCCFSGSLKFPGEPGTDLEPVPHTMPYPLGRKLRFARAGQILVPFMSVLPGILAKPNAAQRSPELEATGSPPPLWCLLIGLAHRKQSHTQRDHLLLQISCASEMNITGLHWLSC